MALCSRRERARAEGADNENYREMLVPFDSSILVDELQLNSQIFAHRPRPQQPLRRCRRRRRRCLQYGVSGPDRAAVQTTLKRPNRSRKASLLPNRSISHPRIFGSVGKPNPKKMHETRRRLKRRIFDSCGSPGPYGGIRVQLQLR
jgi:hypothetical protein